MLRNLRLRQKSGFLFFFLKKKNVREILRTLFYFAPPLGASVITYLLESIGMVGMLLLFFTFETQLSSPVKHLQLFPSLFEEFYYSTW